MNQALPLPQSPSTAERLLESYKTDAYFFLASPRGALMTQGLWRQVDTGETTDPGGVMTALARAAEQGMERPLAVGAMPFDPALPGRLFIPSTAHYAGPVNAGPGRPAAITPQCGLRMVPTPEGYADAVSRALERIDRGELEKIVLSRTLELELPQSVDLRALLRTLAGGNPDGYTFAVDIPPAPGDDTPPRTFLGASPELLVSKHGHRLFSNPLAGTRARAGEAEADEARRLTLLRSDKDLREHRLVVEAVADTLAPFCRSLHVPEKPSALATPKLWHLSTRIAGELADPDTSSLELARALHPTPAVCGHPREAARAAIAEIEPFDRGLFTGIVGWTDANGDGEWVVAIRCAEAAGRHLRLYAGAGVVQGSDPQAELAETSAKLQTFLSAMGLAELQGVA